MLVSGPVPGKGEAVRRREFMAGLAAVASYGTTGPPARAQHRARRLGALIVGQITKETLESALRARGWKLGHDLQIEYRISSGDTDQTRSYARELISTNPDLIFVTSNTSMAAIHAERSTIPTVFAMVSDPVGMHYVDSFARPGHNVTGFTPFEPSLGGKWVSILKEAAPHIERIGLVYNPEPGNNAASFRASIDQVVGVLGIVSVETPSGGSSDIERLILSLKDKPNSGLIFLPDAFTSATSARQGEITALVARCRLPAIYPLRSFCTAGGLISYGVDIKKIVVGAASYVDRILRGANPAELPVQAPTEFELIVNQKAAKQLGLQLPRTLLASADEVIE
jgi:putative ABC transport system substrate-binding protein